VRPVGGPGSHLLSALARADCLIVLPETTDVHPAGTDVELIMLDRDA
jgi:molybdopterin molybdotransferase